MTSLREPTIAEIIRAALDARCADLRVSLPGEIVKFDPAKQLVHVRPLLREAHEDEAGVEVVEELPVIPNVPVQMYGAGDLVLTFPVEPGDPCLLVFTDRSLDLWKERGTSVDPVDLRRHNLTDAVAFVGVRAKPVALSGFDTDAAALRHANGKGVFVKSGGVDLGIKDPSDAVALASKVEAEINKLYNALAALTTVVNAHATVFSAHVHVITAGPPPAFATAAVPAAAFAVPSPPSAVAPVGSSVVKCE
jgi:hypothetical protein